jgi:hypothetical protein
MLAGGCRATVVQDGIAFTGVGEGVVQIVG